MVSLVSGGLQPIYAAEQTQPTFDDFRAVWVSTVLNLDYPSSGTTNSEQLKAEAQNIIQTVKFAGLNAIILQVRPTADAIYPSAYFPWSKYLTGKQGVAPDNQFDPLKYWIEEAHKNGIELHAWINPYRITRKTDKEPAHDFQSLASNHPAVLHPEWVVKHTDGNLYFNPGIPEVRQYIAKSVEELIRNYDVDGIHFDDYFYPSTNFNDATTFAQYGSQFKNIGDWRRDNVDQLIRDVYTTIKSIDATVQFGVSPFGIWANKKNNAFGSETNGNESYYNQYADTRKWVQNNMIDYIAPQIYWNIGYSVADYAILTDWWNKVVEGTNVKLYIGHAAYRVGNKDKANPWQGVNEISRQIALNRTRSQIDGSIFFRYAFIRDNSELKRIILTAFDSSKMNSGGSNTGIFNNLIIGRPIKETIQTTSSSYYIGGASNPNLPLYLNGVEVANRTSQGYFGVFVPLKNGSNTFVFLQNGIEQTRKITKYSPVTTKASPMKTIQITSVWPQNTRMITNNEEISFYCKAPIGATVNVSLAGKTFTLNPKVTKTNSKEIYATEYTLTTKWDTLTGTPSVVDLGAPIYSMNFQGKSYSVQAPASVKIAMANAPFVAIVKEDYTDSYKNPYGNDGAHFLLNKGMTDYITGIYGSYFRLSSGIWVKKESVTTSEMSLNNGISSIEYQQNRDFLGENTSDAILFNMPMNVVSFATFDGKMLKVTFAQTQTTSGVALPTMSFVSNVTYKTENNMTSYEINFVNPKELSGYSLQKVTSGYKLVLDKKFKAYSKSSQLPLMGTVIMIDPGHGGKDSGAIGLLGALKPEKTVVLDIASRLKDNLESLGAKVVMTRVGDQYVTLQERLKQFKESQADLFISIHGDSLEETRNLSNVKGFTTYYKDSIAKSFADCIQSNVTSLLGRTGRGVKNMNFYVVRGTWAPSILLETGFMPNPEEFQILVDPNEQERLAKNLTDSIVQYFSN